jgi:CheY-like chemotaxis protein
MRVLITDDDVTMRDILSIFVSLMGHQVDSTDNGLKGLNMLKEASYDVIITDGFMPEMTGFELCRIVRERFPHIFIIGLTGSSKMQEFENAGAHACFYKPIQFHELQQAMESYFEAKQATGSRSSP